MSASSTDPVRFARALGVALLASVLAGCAALSPQQAQQVDAIVGQARPVQTDCERPDACARPSELHALAGEAFAASTADAPKHYTLLLDRGSDALLARIDLIRSATTSIDLQTYIFDEDDAGRFVLDELIAAAKRGVRVRLLMDQLSALKRVDTLAALAGVHANLQTRIYNPVLGRARMSYPGYVFAAACCWRQLNKRMHSKLLLVDGAIGITGGRNYQDDYYDWDAEYNFRDRDLLVAGPAARDMGDSFERYWNDRRSVPVEHLSDVGRRLLRGGVPALKPADFAEPERVRVARSVADDPGFVREQLLARVLPVGAVEYVADPPGKGGNEQVLSPASRTLRDLILGAQDRVILQTPYLVLSKPAREVFRTLQAREDPPHVIVSTNSLASTDAFIAYALSYKYKRRYLRQYGFEIYEMKPFPQDAPIDVATTGAIDTGSLPPARPQRVQCDRNSVVDCVRARQLARRPVRRPLEREFTALAYGSRRSNSPVPLKRAGVRMGLHAKSLVIDESVGVVGTHNFDPRSDRYNTESMVVIRDPAFARELAASIGRDISPANSWVIAPREKPALLSGLDYSVGKASEQLPIFDLWPRRYATSYEFKPSAKCPLPVSPRDPRFRDCYEAVGDFPEVALGFKSVITRIFTAFGAGLAPIL
ncbi:phospholipase D family protein [Cognatilysobacter segetis]|uniref:phospholipase D family protein n=1 Tax=Cognatilysobacter segetis TaxID=2492394 RepID=UPI00106109BF|nr:phospholipase D family protein [Lysobacter segetis]